MKKETRTLMGRLKMFRHYFFKYWNDKAARVILEEKQTVKTSLIDDATNLFDIISASGVIKEEYGSKVYHLLFKQTQKATNSQLNGKNVSAEEDETAIERLMQQIGNVDQDTGLSAIEEDSYEGSPLRRANSSSGSKVASKRKDLEIFLDGGMFTYDIANLITKYTFSSETDSRAFMVRVNAKVEPGEKYTVYS
jgi:phage baseplate assembly protein W